MFCCLAVSTPWSAGPNKGVLLSVTVGTEISTQIGLDESGLKKLHSFLVAADAACSKGDLPVAAVEARLVAVAGFATAAVATAPPAELAAAEPEAPTAAIGAIQPCKPRLQKMGKK